MPRTAAKSGDAFAFSPARDTLGRTVSNTTTLMTAPWMAFWALAFEAMNPENYRR
jgi:hypothetical protein